MEIKEFDNVFQSNVMNSGICHLFLTIRAQSSLRQVLSASLILFKCYWDKA